MGASLFRAACARFATGITVVTTTDSHGRPHGLTVNSFTSVSLDPPLILVCLGLRVSLLEHFRSAETFAVNILAADQQEISRRFASPLEDRFQGVAWKPGHNGTPVLDGTLATMECNVAQLLDAGDHVILVGEVRHAEYRDGEPLLYFNSRYSHLNVTEQPGR